MGYDRSLNLLADNFSGAIWYLKELLKTAGWVVKLAGTNTTYHVDEDPFTTSMDVSNNWIMLEAPNGRQVAFQRSSEHYKWGYAYSPNGLFTGGSASVLCSAGTDQITVWDRVNDTTTNSPGADHRVHIVANDTPINGEYGFVMVGIIASNDVRTLMALDPVTQNPTGESHPVVAVCSNNVFDLATWSASTQTTCRRYTMHKSDISEEKTASGAGYGYTYIFGTSHPYKALNSYVDGKERPMILPVYNGLGGYLGISHYFQQAPVFRDYPAIDSEKNHLYVGQLLIMNIFDGVTDPLTI